MCKCKRLSNICTYENEGRVSVCVCVREIYIWQVSYLVSYSGSSLSDSCYLLLLLADT